MVKAGIYTHNEELYLVVLLYKINLNTFGTEMVLTFLIQYTLSENQGHIQKSLSLHVTVGII